MADNETGATKVINGVLAAVVTAAFGVIAAFLCGSAAYDHYFPAPAPVAAPALGYATSADLMHAAVKAGYACEDTYDMGDSATCYTDAGHVHLATFTVYGTPTLDHSVTVEEAVKGHRAVVYTDAWTIELGKGHADHAAAQRLAKTLGGNVIDTRAKA